MSDELEIGSKYEKYTVIDVRKGRLHSKDILRIRCECGKEKDIERCRFRAKPIGSCLACSKKRVRAIRNKLNDLFDLRYEITKEVPIVKESKLDFYDIE